MLQYSVTLYCKHLDVTLMLSVLLIFQQVTLMNVSESSVNIYMTIKCWSSLTKGSATPRLKKTINYLIN